MSEEIKIVISLKEDSATIGIQKHDCDPVFVRVEGDLPAVIAGIPALVDEARIKWDSNPRNPKCETSLAPPTPPAAPRTTQQPAKSTDQKAMF